jgi:hypothetical protein
MPLLAGGSRSIICHFIFSASCHRRTTHCSDSLGATHCTLMYDRLLRSSFCSTAGFACGEAPRLAVCNRLPFAGVKAEHPQRNNHPHRHSTLRRLRCKSASGNGGRSSALPPPPPDPDAAPDAVAEWARAIFLSEVALPDDRMNLAKVGLLISLEEEAAAQAHRAANDPTILLPDLLVLRRQLARLAGCILLCGPRTDQSSLP